MSARELFFALADVAESADAYAEICRDKPASRLVPGLLQRIATVASIADDELLRGPRLRAALRELAGEAVYWSQRDDATDEREGNEAPKEEAPEAVRDWTIGNALRAGDAVTWEHEAQRYEGQVIGPWDDLRVARVKVTRAPDARSVGGVQLLEWMQLAPVEPYVPPADASANASNVAPSNTSNPASSSSDAKPEEGAKPRRRGRPPGSRTKPKDSPTSPASMGDASPTAEARTVELFDDPQGKPSPLEPGSASDASAVGVGGETFAPGDRVNWIGGLPARRLDGSVFAVMPGEDVVKVRIDDIDELREVRVRILRRTVDASGEADPFGVAEEDAEEAADRRRVTPLVHGAPVWWNHVAAVVERFDPNSGNYEIRYVPDRTEGPNGVAGVSRLSLRERDPLQAFDVEALVWWKGVACIVEKYDASSGLYAIRYEKNNANGPRGVRGIIASDLRDRSPFEEEIDAPEAEGGS